MSESPEDIKAEIADLELQLEKLKAQLPAHSISPAWMTALDELEDELAEARGRLAKTSEESGA
jgi:ribosomal protein L29